MTLISNWLLEIVLNKIKTFRYVLISCYSLQENEREDPLAKSESHYQINVSNLKTISKVYK